MFLEHRSEKSPWVHPAWTPCRERCADVVTPYRFRWVGDSSGIDPKLVEVWDQVTARSSLKLQRGYINALSQASIAGRKAYWRRAVLFYDDQDAPIGAASFSVTQFDAPSVADIIAERSAKGSALLRALRFGDRPMNGLILTCGGASESGGAGFVFAQRADRARATKGLLCALREAARTLKASNPVSAILVQGELATPELRRAGYTQFSSEPDMMLTLDAEWETYDHYLHHLTSKYRVKAHRADAKSSALTTRALTPEEVKRDQGTMRGLYNQVTSRAHFSLDYPEVSSLAELMTQLPRQVRVFGYWLSEELIGFRVSLYSLDPAEEVLRAPYGSSHDLHHTLYAYAVGLNYEHAREHSLYPRMLNDYIREAISRGVHQLSFGRTASEIKSTLGAAAQPTEIYLRYQQPLINLALPLISRRVELPEFHMHTPFKAAWYEKHAPRELR